MYRLPRPCCPRRPWRPLDPPGRQGAGPGRKRRFADRRALEKTGGLAPTKSGRPAGPRLCEVTSNGCVRSRRSLSPLVGGRRRSNPPPLRRPSRRPDGGRHPGVTSQTATAPVQLGVRDRRRPGPAHVAGENGVQAGIVVVGDEALLHREDDGRRGVRASGNRGRARRSPRERAVVVRDHGVEANLVGNRVAGRGARNPCDEKSEADERARRKRPCPACRASRRLAPRYCLSAYSATFAAIWTADSWVYPLQSRLCCRCRAQPMSYLL